MVQLMIYLLVYENAPSVGARYCPDMLCCAFLHKLSAWVRNIIVFYQYLLRSIKIGRFGRYRQISKA